jgi:SAM-dependent methyltransferase
MIARRYPNEDATAWRRWLKHTSVKSHSARILDVGCGQGWHLSQLHSLGFTSLSGVDPYLSKNICHDPVRIYACPLSGLSGSLFDLITLHHSLEHMPDQMEAFQQISHLLAPGGDCLVRIPIVSRGPWKMYGTDWAEIDAPRHFVLHTEMSLKLAAEPAGLSIKCVQYESEPFTYAASELYRRGLSLYDTEQKRQRTLTDVFDSAEWHQFELLSKRHHIPGWAGRAVFFLTRTGDQEISSDLSE